MELTDILLESHIVSEGQITKEQLKEIEQLLENATEVTLEEIAEVLENGGHKVIQKHAHSLQVGEFNSQIVNEENPDFLLAIGELVNNFKDQTIRQPNDQKVR
jgi:hypothetical protein